MLYRIDWEFDEYQGMDEWKTIKTYQYVFGIRNLGKACLAINENTHVVRIVKLAFSFKGLYVYLKNTVSSFKNETV